MLTHNNYLVQSREVICQAKDPWEIALIDICSSTPDDHIQVLIDSLTHIFPLVFRGNAWKQSILWSFTLIPSQF